MTKVTDLLKIADNAYDPFLSNEFVGNYEQITFDQDSNFWMGGTGFRAKAYYSSENNTLVLAYAGTNDKLDLMTDVQLAVKGTSNQDVQASQFAQETKSKLRSMGVLISTLFIRDTHLVVSWRRSSRHKMTMPKPWFSTLLELGARWVAVLKTPT